MPLPVDDRVFRSVDPASAPPRALFLGYSTPHREELLSAEIIESATRSTLAKAEQLGCTSLALVAFGTGVGGFPLEEAARIMVGVARAHEGRLEQIVFAVHGDDAERAFRQAIG